MPEWRRPAISSAFPRESGRYRARPGGTPLVMKEGVTRRSPSTDLAKTMRRARRSSGQAQLLPLAKADAWTDARLLPPP